MKRLKFFSFAGGALLITFLIGHTVYLSSFKPTEVFPEDEYLFVQKGNALIISAHDDDIAAMAGTIARLSQNGWRTKHVWMHSPTKERESTHLKAVSYIAQDAALMDIGDKPYRYIPDSIQYSWMPIPKEQFASFYEVGPIKKAIIDEIESFEAGVILTLDHEIGLYGNPDHIFISQLLVEILQENPRKVKRIYQSVFPDSYEDRVFEQSGKNKKYPSPYDTANAMYNIHGMPEPDVQIGITDYSWEKKRFLTAYAENEKKNIRRFIPFYEQYPHWLYFHIFDKEYFRVIKF